MEFKKGEVVLGGEGKGEAASDGSGRESGTAGRGMDEDKLGGGLLETRGGGTPSDTKGEVLKGKTVDLKSPPEEMGRAEDGTGGRKDGDGGTWDEGEDMHQAEEEKGGEQGCGDSIVMGGMGDKTVCVDESTKVETPTGRGGGVAPPPATRTRRAAKSREQQ